MAIMFSIMDFFIATVVFLVFFEQYTPDILIGNRKSRTLHQVPDFLCEELRFEFYGQKVAYFYRLRQSFRLQMRQRHIHLYGIISEKQP